MSRPVCGNCLCTYGDDGSCGCIDNKCSDCGEVNPAEIHTCSPQKHVACIPIEQWEMFIDDLNDYLDGNQKMPFSLFRESLFSMVESSYTTPQTKPLSDEEISKLAHKSFGTEPIGAFHFAREIEAKVRGEK
jgi:hypothetical protein